MDVATPDVATPDAPASSCARGDTIPGAVVPDGFCIGRFASVAEPRALSLAPNGDLFVAAPSAGTPGGAIGGPGAIVVLADDDGDGRAESYTFARDLPTVHGLAVTDDAVYFATDQGVWRTPYASGQRAETPGARAQLAAFDPSLPAQRWTHGLARSASGTLLASRGIAGGICPSSSAAGGVLAVQGGAMSPMMAGLNNPMYLRCRASDELCLASEPLDHDDDPNSFDKLVQVSAGANFGAPCCYDDGAPASGATSPCRGVTPEVLRLPAHSTPFGFDWQQGAWPAPYQGALFLALHGSFYSTPAWQGAGIVFSPTDPATHLPAAAPQLFVSGFGPAHGLQRPADLAFTRDGVLYFADDLGNAVYWVAPASLLRGP